MTDVTDAEADARARAVVDHLWPEERGGHTLGIRLVDVRAGRATLEMEIGPELTNAHGVGQGGFTFTLVDMAMGLAINSYGEMAFAAGAEIDFINPVQVGSTITATATVIHRRGRAGITDGIVTSDDGTTIALFRGRTRSVGRPVIAE